MPSPVEVWDSLRTNWAMLIENTWPTFIESVAGFFLGNGVAILLAVLFVHWKTAERALMPVAVFVRTIPIVAVAPVLVIMFGQGYTPKILSRIHAAGVELPPDMFAKRRQPERAAAASRW